MVATPSEGTPSQWWLIGHPGQWARRTEELQPGAPDAAIRSPTGAQGRASACSLIPGYFADRDKRVVREVNAAVKQAKELRYDVTIWPIPPPEWRVVAVCDSSTDTSGKQRHQRGYLARGPVSVLFWKSAKHTRKASSPQLCETYASSDCVVEAAWMKCLLESIMWADFDIVYRRMRSCPRPRGKPYVLPDEHAHLSNPEAIFVSSSKGLYDSLNNSSPGGRPEHAMEVPIILEFARQAVARFRWAPHNVNPADASAKNRGAHLAPLIDLMSTRKYQLRVEQSELDDRRERRVQGSGSVRLKSSAAAVAWRRRDLSEVAGFQPRSGGH